MMNTMNKTLLVYFLFLCSLFSFAQHTTLSADKSAILKQPPGKHKVMIIPFEPRMYLGEVDMYINQETKLSAKEIRARFRDGINEQLYKSLKTKFGVVDLMDDTMKTRKDVEKIYQYLAYDYQKIPDQTNYSPPKKEKEEKGIKDGQIDVETNSDARFMNAKIKSPKLVPYLYDKYKTDIFLFVNQLDIKGSATNGPAELNSPGNRKIIVHYTVYTYDAFEINSGIAEIDFPTNINNPTKIIGTYFSKLSQTITSRIEKAVTPVTPK
jgi:hypothetical protein